MSNRSQSFAEGCVAASPLILGIAPWGILCGATSIHSGYCVFEAVAMSSVIFAGASQLIVTQLLNEYTPLMIVLLSGIMINLRMAMYSASISNHLSEGSLLSRSLLAYFLTDQAYATSIRRFENESSANNNKVFFYFGAGLFVWLVFNITTLLGALFGTIIPESWDVEFIVPLCFIALLIPQLKNNHSRLVASVSAGTALILVELPLNIGLLAASVVGILVGYLSERRVYARPL